MKVTPFEVNFPPAAAKTPGGAPPRAPVKVWRFPPVWRIRKGVKESEEGRKNSAREREDERSWTRQRWLKE